MNTDFLVRSEELLRKLTSQFIALNFAAFHSKQDAVQLIAQGGDLVTDVMAKVVRPCWSNLDWRQLGGGAEDGRSSGGAARTGDHREEEVRYISGIKVFTSLGQVATIDPGIPNPQARLCVTPPPERGGVIGTLLIRFSQKCRIKSVVLRSFQANVVAIQF